jgi:hypothetical protein
MTRANKAGSREIVREKNNGSSVSIAAAGLAMLMTLWVGNARNSAAKGNSGIRSADLKMSVRVDNRTGISAKKLRFAESEAARIYAKAGVYLEWHECPSTARAGSADSACEALLTASDLRLRIVDSVKLKGSHATSEASGYAIGDLALVQLQYLQELPTPSEYFRYLMLGRVIAHEIGHALLGPEHSSQGIMQARWGNEQLLRAASELVFTPDQEKALRLAIKARLTGKPDAFQTDATSLWAFLILCATRQ